MSRLATLAVLGSILAACSFPTGGVPIGGDDDDVPPDATASPDACVPTAETCDGTDEDCDGNFDEGFASGDACDGDDADLCLDDMMVCDGSGAEVCGNTSGDDNLELCNGADLDEDCDGNFDEGYALVACDGGDADLCNEGTATCADDGLGVVCGDVSGDNAEICDNADQDCDLAIDETFDLTSDEANCGDCGVTCTNAFGTTACLTGTCTPSCSNGAAQCNGDPDDGCERVDTSPLCADATVVEFTINGDDAAGNTASTTGTTERFIRVRIREANGAGTVRDLTARFSLTSGAGTDFDLHVYCKANCDATPLSAATDIINVGRSETVGSVNMEVIVEVRYDPTTPSTSCEPWTLTMEGNTGVASTCGD